jgi:hypothetical protein
LAEDAKVRLILPPQDRYYPEIQINRFIFKKSFAYLDVQPILIQYVLADYCPGWELN